MFCLHRWSRWRDPVKDKITYFDHYLISYTTNSREEPIFFQSRTCEKCGKMQARKVKLT